MSKKASVKDKLLARLLAGDPYGEIYASASSKSSFYGAYDEWLKITEKRYEEKSQNLAKLDLQIKNLKNSIRELETNRDHVRKALKEFNTRKKELEQIKGEIKERNKVLSQRKALADRGIPFDFVKHIYEMGINGKELTSRIGTVEAYEQEKKFLAGLVEKRKGLEKDIEDFKKKKDNLKNDKANLEEEIRSKKQEYDEEEKKTRGYRKVVETTQGFIDDGYTFEDLKSLQNSLKAIAVKGKPKLSLSRLIEGLQGAKTLNRLYNEIGKAEKKLETLNMSIAKVEGILDGYEKKVLAVLDKVRERGINDIKTICNSAKGETSDLRKSITGELKEIGSSYTQELNKLNKNATASIKEMSGTALTITAHLDSEVKRISTNLKNVLFTFTQQIERDNKKYNALKDKIRDQEILAKYGYYLLGVLKYPEEIKDTPPPIIAQLMNRIDSYVQINFPKETAYPSKKVNKLSDYGGKLYTSNSYKLAATSLFLKEELERLAVESAKSEPRES